VSNNAQQANIAFGITRKSLEAVLVHACPHCEAPGIYKADDRTADRWPGCWNPARNNRPVGDVCPNCNRPRKKDKNLGELTASMPRWMWNCILGFKWCVIQTVMLKQKLGARYG
jgi:hypothetical protein